jgi:hypothetical protein
MAALRIYFSSERDRYIITVRLMQREARGFRVAKWYIRRYIF